MTMAIPGGDAPSDADYHDFAAEVYDLWWPAGALGDEAFYREKLEAEPGPALEVACGTGRLLLPYLQAGLEVEGVDCSAPMLERCRDKARALGLEPVLHEQHMQDLDLSCRYQTIYVPFRSFLILHRREEARAALHAFRDHLEPGGRLLISLFVPDLDALRDHDGTWRHRKTVTRPRDGARVDILDRAHARPVDQLLDVTFRFDVWEDDRLVESRRQDFTLRYYWKHEFALLLEACGFADIFPHGDFGPEEAGEGSSEMTWSARAHSA